MKLFFRTDDSGKRHITLIGLLTFFIVFSVLVSLLGDFLMSRSHPHRYARADACLGQKIGTTYWPNSCDFEIKVRYCFYLGLLEGQVRPDQVCHTKNLDTGQGVETLIDDRLSVRAEGREIVDSTVWACKSPYEPGMVPNRHKQTMLEKGCQPLRD